MNAILQMYSTLKFIVCHPLSVNHKIFAIINFIKWQIAVRILKKSVLVPWVNNSIFIAGIGEAGLTGNIYAGLMEYEDMAFLLHALQPTETFIDIGANIGAYTILASKVVGSNSIAFEPIPNTVERLKDQIHINRIESTVDIRNIGIGDKEGPLYFTNNNDTVNKVSLAIDSKNTTMVNVSTLDIELDQDNQYFLKIDVEGFEFNVIKGASEILSKNNVSAIIIELNGSCKEFGQSNEDIHNKLLSFGYIAIAYEPHTRTITELKNYNTKSGNTIYIKDLSIISERCKSAPLRFIHTAFGIKI